MRKNDKLYIGELSVFEPYDSAQAGKARKILQEELEHFTGKIVVLDDDPTGTQTVHDVSVYTDWTLETIREGFLEDSRLFFVLTNFRGLTEAETEKVHLEIGHTVGRVAKETGKNFILISRSDSTLRGHFPLETETLRNAVESEGFRIDGEILCPFFLEGGRYTIENEQYVRYGDTLIKASETEFAKDPTFGFSTSDLPAYIEKKTGGRYPKESVICIRADDLRNMQVEKIERQLNHIQGFDKVCVNAVCEDDLVVFCIALLKSIGKGQTFLFRSAASLVKVLGGIEDRPLLCHDELVQKESCGGVIIVGSYTEKTTEQIQALVKLPRIVPVEFNSDLVEDKEAFEDEIQRCVKEEEKAVLEGKTVVCYTRRKRFQKKQDTKESMLLRSTAISEGVQRLVGDLGVKPGFIIAKGGITSSDVAVKGLRVKKARVMGQIQPGVPVWKTGEESRYPGIPYIIFPGNVGNADTLLRAVQILTE